MSIIRCKVCGKITAITLYLRKSCGVLCPCQYKEIEKKAQKIVFDTIIANLCFDRNVVTMDEMVKSLYRVGQSAGETVDSINNSIKAVRKLAAQNEECKVVSVENEEDALRKAALFGVPVTREEIKLAFKKYEEDQ